MATITKEWVEEALELADNERSKITERERELFGQSSIRQRCLINNLCASGKINYLEIGIYRGATAISAVMGNDCKAVAVDNFRYDERESGWAPEGHIHYNMKSQLEANIQRYDLHPETKIPGAIEIVEGDFQEVDLSKHPKFDVCHFDLSPVNQAVYDDFFEKILPCMTTQSVIIFTQQSNAQHAEELNKSLLRHADKVEELFSYYRTSGGMSDATKYFSGIRVLGLKRKIVKAAPKAATAKKQ